jgi:hypothetical protein
LKFINIFENILFYYLSEDFLLELRFDILKNIADYFMVVLSNKTWQNNKNFY